jgi:hypothetical protein
MRKQQDAMEESGGDHAETIDNLSYVAIVLGDRW